MPPEPLGQRRLILDTVILGVAGAFAAQLFTLLLRGTSALFLTFFAHYVPSPACQARAARPWR